MKNEEIRALETEDIKNRINDAREELMNLRFRLMAGNLADYSQIRLTRRKIARLSTILNQRIKEGK